MKKLLALVFLGLLAAVPVFVAHTQSKSKTYLEYLKIDMTKGGEPLLDVANLHAGCATRLSRFLESHHPMFRFGLKGDPLGVREDGCQHAPTGPGLGVEIDWDWIEDHAVEVIDGQQDS